MFNKSDVIKQKYLQRLQKSPAKPIPGHGNKAGLCPSMYVVIPVRHPSGDCVNFTHYCVRCRLALSCELCWESKLTHQVRDRGSWFTYSTQSSSKFSLRSSAKRDPTGSRLFIVFTSYLKLPTTPSHQPCLLSSVTWRGRRSFSFS